MADVRRSMRCGIGLAVAVVLVVPWPGWAQAVKEKRAAPREVTEIEEITVTAQRREESMQEIPISVTALTAATLAQKGVADMVDLGQAVANVRIAANPGSSSTTMISMRGVAQGDPNAALQPTVGLYVDGAYIAKITGNSLDLEDLERVEVLRGPQGTLYGRNTITGAVNLITAKPTNERSVTLSTEVGNFDSFKGRLTVNLPLIGKNGFFQSDTIGTLSLRQNVMYKSHDGYYTNVAPPNKPSPPASGSADFNNLNRVFTMTALRWQPTKEITVDYSFEYHRYRDSTNAFQDTYIYPGSPVDGGPFDLRPYVRTNRVDSIGNSAVYMTDVQSLHRLADDGNHRMHVLTGAWDLGEVGSLGRVTVKSISSYRSFFSEQNVSLAGAPIHMLDSSGGSDMQHWSEELQWVGAAPRVHYVLGAYYYGENISETYDFVSSGGAVALPHQRRLIKSASYAPYGQLTWTPPILGDKLSVTAGIRYTQEQVHADLFQRCVTYLYNYGGQLYNICNLGLPTASLNDWNSSRGKAFGGTDALSPMGDIAYQWTDDFMTYFRVARGFKSGGFNTVATDPISFEHYFKPETLLQYEAGFKSQWFDKRLRVNASGFYSDYRDMQVSVFRASPTTGTESLLTNAAAAEIWGSELEVVAMPLRGLEVTASYGFVSPTFKKWLDQKFDANGPVFDEHGNPVLEDVAGQRSFAMTPRHQFTVGLTYTAPPTSSGTFSAGVDTYWQNQVTYISNDNTAGAQAMKGWSYAVVNGRLRFANIPLQKGSLDLALFGRNLFDRKYRTYGVDLGPTLGWSGNLYGDPRTFGLQVTYNLTAGQPAPPPVL